MLPACSQTCCHPVASMFPACVEHCESISFVWQRGLRSFQSCFIHHPKYVPFLWRQWIYSLTSLWFFILSTRLWFLWALVKPSDKCSITVHSVLLYISTSLEWVKWCNGARHRLIWKRHWTIFNKNLVKSNIHWNFYTQMNILKIFFDILWDCLI